MCTSASIYMWLTLLNTLIQHHRVCADEYLPMRLETKVSKHSNSAYRPPQVNHSKKLEYFATFVPCSIACFLKPPDYEIVACTKNSDEFEGANSTHYKAVACQQTRGGGEITVGSKESVRGIEPGTLGILLHSDDDITPTSGQLSIHLNINMVRLDAKVFRGLETVVTEVRLLNVVRMHPDSLVELPHLRVFEIESGQTPTLLGNENKEPTGTNHSSKPVLIDRPAYIRLLTADTGVPISFNFETSCHRCKLDNLTEQDFVIVSFKKSVEAKTASKLSRYSSFSMIFPQTCPRIEHAVGCHGYRYENVRLPDGIIKFDDGTSQQDIKEAKHVVQDSYPPSLLILLSIWCTLLTILTSVIIGIMYLCIRGISRQKPPPKWLSIICANQQSSLEEISSNSTNSGFYNKPTNGIEPESGMLINPLMNESRTSWNSLQIRPRMSKSDHNLKDRGYRTQRYFDTVTGRRMCRIEQNRRSIGSQTDFTDVDSEMAIYSSLRRSAMPLRDPTFMAPPTRTTSQYALVRPRQSYQMDFISRRTEPGNKLSFNGFDLVGTKHDGRGGEQHTNIVDVHSVYDYQGTLINGHPTVFSLPPVAPISHAGGGRSPVTKSKFMQENCT